ncbi:hypothetical protein J6W91_00455 [Candidatus Saccharibacteria bacterium]|nr:hypothetical protein [Candidatus Saccharibacteria bacterium]
MKYVISEKMDKIASLTKARSDAEEIAIKNGYKKIEVGTDFAIRYKKYEKPVQAYLYLKNHRKWDKLLGSFKDGDTVLIQLCFFNTAINFYKLVEKYQKKLKIVVLVHDLDFLRYIGDDTKSGGYTERVTKDEVETLKNCYKIISHNEKMTKKLVEYGIPEEKIVNLELFDYLDDKNQKATVSEKGNIIIAGNLNPNKASYIKDLHKIDAKFGLYGIDYDKSYDQKNVEYFGAFKADELIPELKGSFGLVWDGTTIKTCDGHTGQYTKINNPHKVSLYLSAGLPVIIWKEAALASFIEKNKVGFTVSSLEEIPEKLRKITKKDFDEMKKNTEKIAKKLKTGEFLEKALKEIER